MADKSLNILRTVEIRALPSFIGHHLSASGHYTSDADISSMFFLHWGRYLQLDICLYDQYTLEATTLISIDP